MVPVTTNVNGSLEGILENRLCNTSWYVAVVRVCGVNVLSTDVLQQKGCDMLKKRIGQVTYDGTCWNDLDWESPNLSRWRKQCLQNATQTRRLPNYDLIKEMDETNAVSGVGVEGNMMTEELGVCRGCAYGKFPRSQIRKTTRKHRMNPLTTLENYKSIKLDYYLCHMQGIAAWY